MRGQTLVRSLCDELGGSALAASRQLHIPQTSLSRWMREGIARMSQVEALIDAWRDATGRAASVTICWPRGEVVEIEPVDEAHARLWSEASELALEGTADQLVALLAVGRATPWVRRVQRVAAHLDALHRHAGTPAPGAAVDILHAAAATGRRAV